MINKRKRRKKNGDKKIVNLVSLRVWVILGEHENTKIKLCMCVNV